MRGARDEVCAGAGAGRPECLSSEVPQVQWDLVMRSVSLTGEMLSVDPMTAVMDLRIDLGLIVRPIPAPSSLPSFFLRQHGFTCSCAWMYPNDFCCVHCQSSRCGMLADQSAPKR